MNGGSLIYRNSSLAQQITWNPDNTLLAAEIALHFLRGECDLLRLAKVADRSVADVEAFLTVTTGLPLVIERSVVGHVLVRCDELGESLLVTGKTAAVLRAYIDCQPVHTKDRGDMTLRRQAAL
jgi:hypothetical protein